MSYYFPVVEGSFFFSSCFLLFQTFDNFFCSKRYLLGNIILFFYALNALKGARMRYRFEPKNFVLGAVAGLAMTVIPVISEPVISVIQSIRNKFFGGAK